MSTEEGVYGLILVSGLVATAGSAGTPAGKTLLLTVITVAVFWLAHVYAGAVAAHGTIDAAGARLGLRASIRRAIIKSRGMLAATLAPAIALLLGALGVLTDSAATWDALWVCVAALGAVGFLAFRRKGVNFGYCALGALATASFGVVIIIAKVVISH